MNDVLSNFQMFLDREASKSSPLYAALTALVSRQLQESGPIGQVLAAAAQRQRIPNLLFAAVQRALFDEPQDDLAAYYPSLGGSRAPDDELAAVFTRFVLEHREPIEQALATRETQTNEALRAAQLFPAFGWAQACTRRPLGLIEVGTSAGLLLHVDRYAYAYTFEDGREFAAGEASAEGVPVLRCAVDGPPEQAAKALGPFVGKELRVASRVGLDLNPLDPADPQARAWLEALVWPEHAERRARLRAALDHAARRPVRLRKGDALRILPDAVEGVAANAIPCVFVSNSLAHWTPEGRTALVALVRRLGARRDLVCIVKEGYASGLGLFTDRPDDPPAGDRRPYEVLGAAVFLGGREQLFRLGSAGLHGVNLHWAPAPVG
ncbi:DUF2332 domain-containing protein [Actinocrinis puniceicyclus]|uniref:DUF2332 domain-containing protein n=1 Tax=Actinocrinis puniceicyclus TaxID=977794 RepID=A0A8J7WG29_9ACTN|nr:DUF2332 domain-containing protein [Actinocrinis puniceicyclus]MBS2961561.1 DUF2332 domain-containing protein [Actinocrinis puniceicyclus]